LKVAEAHKSTTAKSQVQAKQEPFFKKEGDSDFFSKSNEASQFFSPTTIQPKLKIGKPNDKYEVEADSMADKVVQRLNNPSSQETTVSDSKTSTAVQAKHSPSKQEEKLQKKEDEDEFSETDTGLQQKAIFESNAEQLDTDVQTKPLIPFIQAKCATCEQEERVQKKEDELSEAGEELQTMAMAGGTATPPDGENIQTKSEGSSTQASSDLQSRLNSSRGGGSPLSSDMQSSMGAAMGADFSNVRVHTGSEAVAMNKDLNAQAFTHGSDIYFNEGKYDTNSDSGKHLLAHELTHTVQQGKTGLIQKQDDDQNTSETSEVNSENDNPNPNTIEVSNKNSIDPQNDNKLVTPVQNNGEENIVNQNTEISNQNPIQNNESVVNQENSSNVSLQEGNRRFGFWK